MSLGDISGYAPLPQKPLLFPETDGFDGFLDGNFTQLIPIREYSFSNYWTDTLPLECLQQALEPSFDNPAVQTCDPSQMHAWSVTYSDCPTSSWSFCRCEQSLITPKQMMDEFGRLPVALRQAARNIIAMPKSNTMAGVAPHFDVVLFGDESSLPLYEGSHRLPPTLMLHETSHVLDYEVDGNFYGDYGYSYDPAFKAAIERDGCFSDWYAASGATQAPAPDLRETWAQIFVLRRYQMTVGDFVPRNLKCLTNQLAVVAGQTDQLMTASTCDLSRKVPQSQKVSKTNYDAAKVLAKRHLPVEEADESAPGGKVVRHQLRGMMDFNKPYLREHQYAVRNM